MSQDIYREYQQHISRNRRRNILKKVVRVLACAVIFCTTYALILPAITLEQETFCGKDEHIHSEACISSGSCQNLICTVDHLQIHAHSSECYSAESALTCGEADYVVHSHAAHCYNSIGTLVCTLPERSAHVHTDSCYVSGETLPEVLHVHTESCNVLQKSGLLCTIEEYEGHTHMDSCYEAGDVLLCAKQENHIHTDACYQSPLVCGVSAEPHSHNASCYERGSQICTMTENHVHGDGCLEITCICEDTDEGHSHTSACYSSRTICTIPENHSHTDACYESVTVCGKREGECHTHDDSCWGSPELTCTQDENHVHDDGCYEQHLICTTAEDPGHSHGDDCYYWETIIGCGLEEGQPEPTEPVEPVIVCTEPIATVHVHDESCFEAAEAEPVLICVETSTDHVHTPECYELSCGVEAHTHSLACFSDPEADLETAADWEVSFAHVELIGNWNEDVIAIAESQLGYVESSRNYAVWEDETTHGYTRYGQWYGSPYGDWCAMYVSFCLYYAEVEGMPLHWGCRPWIEELTDLKLYHEAEIYEPKSGDIVFFDWEGDGLSDHVGLVAEIIVPEEDSPENPIQVKTIEGNSSNCVQYVWYNIDDPRLLGYSELPDNPEIYACGLLRHSHNEYCRDTAGNVICHQIEHIHTDACESRDILYCGQEAHSHTDVCFDENGNLVCELPAHTHTESCTVEAPTEEAPVYHCGLEVHNHSETCYNEAEELVCELAEHIHSEECTAEPATYYCGLEEHTHAEVCYDEVGNLVCRISEHIHTENCLTVPVYLCGMQEHTHTEECYDETCSLICRLRAHTHSGQCIILGGYICGLEEHTHNENCYDAQGKFICTLEEHAHTDACKAQNFYACGIDEHTHAESCYDEDGNLFCHLPEHIHTAACVGRNLYYSDMQIRVHAVIRGVEDLPRKLTLKVRRVVPENEPQVFGDMQVAISEEISSREQYMSEASFFEMYLLSEGELYDLPETATVTVTMEFEEPIFTPDAMADATGTHAFMLTPEGGMQLPAELEDGVETASEQEDTSDPTESILVESVISSIASGFQSILMPALAVDDAAQLEETPAGEMEEESPVEPEIPEESGTIYDVSGLSGEDYGNARQGITSITFETNRISTFAVALANTTQTGEFWTRCDSSEDITDDGTYMIVSVEGNYALTGNSSNNATAVRLQTVKGNTQYYTIDMPDGNAVTNTLYWNFSGSGSSCTIQNQSTSRYLNLSQTTIINNSSSTFKLTYKTPENCWRFSCDVTETTGGWWPTTKTTTYYLRHAGTDSFYRGSGVDISGYNNVFYYTTDMLIFKLSDVTSLNVPADVTDSTSDNEGQETAPEKPDYEDFTSVSGGIYERETAVTDSQGTVSGKAYSDPSTSDIEKHFRKDSFAESQTIDGLVKTDKSVIYGMDDYGAFEEYPANTFGVTLSALGQEYAVPTIETYTAPVDVVFVLDVSGSMATKTSSTTDDDGRDPNRATSVKNAVNSSIAEIMSQHEANRVGIALYSSGGWQMLPLDRYTADNGQYLVCGEKTVSFKLSGHSTTVNVIEGGPTLKNQDGVSFAGAGTFNSGDADPVYQGLGTYTQAGIAQGYNIFQNIGSDVTYETENGKILKRQPVFVLLSDGEPTHSTNNFMDVLNGPIYGDGNGGTENALAIHGYNTVLSANYYKRMVGIQYNKPAMFYSIGMGINTPEDGDGPMVSGSKTGDTYKRAVLDPGKIGKYDTSQNNNTNTIVKLIQMLQSQYTDQSMTVRSNWPDGWTGVPHKTAPVLQANPYAGNYTYANASYFGELPTEELEKIFSEILTETLQSVEYGFVLYENSAVTIVDHIGDGMEIKGTPVLLYGDQTYRNPTVTTAGNATTYVYTGIYEDLHIPDHSIDISKISVRITENADGTQTVEMFVPDVLLPTYTPEMIGQQFYYEQLPVRLIYQVGLTAEAEADVLALQQTGGSLTYYTNKWGGEDHARSDLTPSLNNPFYHDTDDGGPHEAQYSEHRIYKSGSDSLQPGQNCTDTEVYAVDCHDEYITLDGETVYHVYHELGNNGKLVFESETVDIPVEKKWEETYGVLELPEISLTLYRVTPDSENPDVIQELKEIQTISLSGEGDTPWSGVFENVPAPTDNWYYVIAEPQVPDGYQVSYSGETISIIPDNAASIPAVRVTVADQNAELVTVTNTFTEWYELPKTGGAGTIPYTTGGLLLTAAALILLYSNIVKRRKEARPAS